MNRLALAAALALAGVGVGALTLDNPAYGGCSLAGRIDDERTITEKMADCRENRTPKICTMESLIADGRVRGKFAANDCTWTDPDGTVRPGR